MAPREGFEPPTTGLEGRCSIHLSYRGGAAAVRAGGHDTPNAAGTAGVGRGSI